MTWVAIRGEIEELFSQSDADRIESALFNAHKRHLSRWAEYGRWWDKTSMAIEHRRSPAVKARASANAKRRAARLKALARGSVVCRCGAVFRLTEYRVSRGTTKVCSRACPGLPQRQGKRLRCGLTMRELSAGSGINYHALRRRLLAGWSIERATDTPVRPMRARAR